MILEVRIWQMEWRVQKPKADKDLPGEEAGEACLALQAGPVQACLWLQACFQLSLKPGEGSRAPLKTFPGVLVSWCQLQDRGEGPIEARSSGEASWVRQPQVGAEGSG